jgi:hypothetical protein
MLQAEFKYFFLPFSSDRYSSLAGLVARFGRVARLKLHNEAARLLLAFTGFGEKAMHVVPARGGELVLDAPDFLENQVPLAFSHLIFQRLNHKVPLKAPLGYKFPGVHAPALRPAGGAAAQ